jgi:hypothetical protein
MPGPSTACRRAPSSLAEHREESMKQPVRVYVRSSTQRREAYRAPRHLLIRVRRRSTSSRRPFPLVVEVHTFQVPRVPRDPRSARPQHCSVNNKTTNNESDQPARVTWAKATSSGSSSRTNSSRKSLLNLGSSSSYRTGEDGRS